jgi:hypothetical protein
MTFQKNLTLIILLFIATPLFSQSYSPEYNVARQLFAENYEVSESTIDSYWNQIPNLSQEEITTLNSIINSGYIRDYPIISFLDSYISEDLNYILEDDKSAIIFSLFIYKYMSELKYDFSNRAISSFFTQATRKTVEEYYETENLDLFRSLLLFSALEEPFFIEIESMLYGSGLFIDHNMPTKRNGKQETLLDFLDDIEKNGGLPEYGIVDIDGLKEEFAEDYNAKRYANLHTDRKEIEVIALAEETVNPKFDKAVEDYQLFFEEKLKQYDVNAKNEEDYNYFFSKAYYEAIVYINSKHLFIVDFTKTVDLIISHADKAIAQNPNNIRNTYYKALALNLYNIEDRINKSKPLLNTLIKSSDTVSYCYYLKAYQYKELRDYSKAQQKINEALKIKKNTAYKNLDKEIRGLNYYNTIEISPLSSSHFEINIPKFELRDMGVNEGRICMNFIETWIDENGLDQSDDSRKGVIYDFNGNMVLSPSNWNFDENGTNSPERPLYHNGKAAIHIKEPNKHKWVLVDLGGNISKTIHTEYGTEGYIELYRFKDYTVLSTYEKGSKLYDENFNLINHNLRYPRPVSKNIFIDYSILYAGLAPPPFKLKSLNSTLSKTYEQAVRTNYIDNSKWGELKEGFKSNNGIINFKTQQTVIGDYVEIRMKEFMNTSTAALYTDFKNPEYKIYDLNNFKLIKTGKCTYKAGEGFSVKLKAADILEIDNEYFENLHGEFIQNNLFSSIGFKGAYGLVQYHDSTIGLVDRSFRKIEIPNNKDVERIIDAHKNVILIKYRNGKHIILVINE